MHSKTIEFSFFKSYQRDTKKNKFFLFYIYSVEKKKIISNMSFVSPINTITLDCSGNVLPNAIVLADVDSNKVREYENFHKLFNSFFFVFNIE